MPINTTHFSVHGADSCGMVICLWLIGTVLSGLELRLCTSLCLRKTKFLPSRSGRLAPPSAALPCGPVGTRAGRQTVFQVSPS